jgi:hypothetical protein
MNRFLRATLFTLPLALPAVALAQSPSPTSSETNNATQDNANRDVNPPNSVDTSGSTKTSERNLGGDLNMNSDQSSTTTTTTKRTPKRSKRSTDTSDTNDARDQNINTR